MFVFETMALLFVGIFLILLFGFVLFKALTNGIDQLIPQDQSTSYSDHHNQRDLFLQQIQLNGPLSEKGSSHRGSFVGAQLLQEDKFDSSKSEKLSIKTLGSSY